MSMQNLNIQTIPLTGKHLIEASAGTGKTHNITRLYLRLLLERRLSVEKILVMTFTKDATEELRGRIEGFIREAINDWSSLIKNDEFFIEIAKKVDEREALDLLKTALLFLDEASIYTIHGFCKRVLSQHAFSSGLPFNALMETDSQELVIESCQDYYRVLAQESVNEFLLLAEFWPDPLAFISQFSQAIASQQPLEVLAPKNIVEEFLLTVKKSLTDLEVNHPTLVSHLVDVKKGEEREVRLVELTSLVLWLKNIAVTDVDSFNPNQLSTMPDAFIDGRRYGRSKFKAEIVEIFIQVNQVKEQVKALVKQINKAKAFNLVRAGIYQIRQAVSVKKENQNILTFDDLITTLAYCLSSENDLNGKFASTLFTQYPVALVDEFQDTDPQQFHIIKAIYYNKASKISSDTTTNADVRDRNKDSQSAIYMIGDPKQAIYGFRGGDVFAYLAARQDCDYQWLMDTNWRSTPSMVTGYNRLFYGNELTKNARDVFGYNIPYLPVKSAKKESKSANNNGRKALQFIHFNDDSVDKKGGVKQSFRAEMANWCADEIIRLFNADDSLKAQDIAILVRDGSEAQSIKDALHRKKLASVFLSNRSNLLHSHETKQLLALLKGILFVENERWYTAALASGLLGFTPKKLYQLQCDEFQWQKLKFSFASFREEWLNKGFISMALKLMHQHFHIDEKDQDRVLTNLLHLFELLQSASTRHRQPQELLYWFEQQINLDNPETEVELRLESDDDLIRIVTQHGAKGLEYPIVFVPFATRFKDPLRFGSRSVTFIKYHKDVDGGERPLVLSLDGSKEAKKAMADEAYAESIRLLYVAVTRAERQCYIFTTEFDHYEQSPLGLTLKWQKDQDILINLQALMSDNTKEIGVLTIPYDDLGNEESVEQLSVQVNKRVNNASAKLTPQVAKFYGHIERDWWLSSFSALKRNLRHVGVSSPDRDHEFTSEQSIIDPQEQNLDNNLLRFTLAKGAHTGNLLHDILEHTDFIQADWQTCMKWPLVKYGELTTGFTQDDLQAWLVQVLNSALTDANCSLANLTLNKTLRESEFYFPMQSASSEKLSNVLTEHRASIRQVLNLQSLSPVVRLPSYKTLKGMMHGFIDLVFEHQGKYFVCDYKSSHLGDQFKYYQQENLLYDIENNYYDLQYLIYCLALHRHLKLSLKDYDPNVHFGGIYCFYLRGMTDDSNHQGSGIYYRKITSEELNQLDEIFLGDKQTKGLIHEQ